MKSSTVQSKDFVKALQDINTVATTDRVIAIVSNAYLEAQLVACLRLAFGPGKVLDERLFEAKGVLATQSSRIYMSEAIGLISPHGREDLLNINKIRNAFAHQLWVDSFENDEVKTVCKKLRMYTSFYNALADQIPNKTVSAGLRKQVESATTRQLFVMSVTGLMVTLQGVIDEGPVKLKHPKAFKYWEEVEKE